MTATVSGVPDINERGTSDQLPDDLPRDDLPHDDLPRDDLPRDDLPRDDLPRDDLGFAMAVTGPVRRVVSLVPSLTESVAVTRPGALVGATQWCTHPADLDVPRVRGTKNPDIAAIVAQRPDLVLANQEENRKLDVERLRAAGVPVWVTVIRSVDEALASLRRMFTEALGWPVPGWLDEADRTWAHRRHRASRRLPASGRPSASGATRGWP